MSTRPSAPRGYRPRPLIPTPPAEDILAAVRRGSSYSELAAIYGCSESTLKRRVHDSGLVERRRHGLHPAPLVKNEEPEWMGQGLCAQTDPELFFPEKGRSPRVARGLCGTCPVATECLTYALDNDERFGVWGGLTARERQKVKKAQR